MSRTSKIVSVIVAVIVVIACVYFFSHKTPKVYGATTPSTSTAIYGTESVGAPLLVLGGAVTGPNAGSYLAQQTSIGSCTTATSTQFIIANPFSATSTVVVESVIGAGQATSTQFSIGTTTKPTTASVASTDVSASLVSSATVATSTQFTAISGGNTQLGSGQVSSGASTISKIVVGPSENIAMYATSTYGGVGAVNYTPGLTCTYKLRWMN